MVYSNERTILKELQTVLNNKLMDMVRTVAQRSEDEVVFNVAQFSDASLNDQLIEHEEFGLIFVDDSGYESEPEVGQSVINTVRIGCQAIIIDRGNLARDISLLRMALAELILNSDFDFETFSSTKVESTKPTPLDFGAKDSSIKYVASGVVAIFKLGF